MLGSIFSTKQDRDICIIGSLIREELCDVRDGELQFRLTEAEYVTAIEH